MRITLNRKCRLCRAQGAKLYLKGARCFSSKCPIEKKGAVPSGMHGLKRKKKSSDYGLQLKAKQHCKRLFVVSEKQFRNTYLKAKKLKGMLGNNFLTLLEQRLDNIVYLSGLSLSRSHARILVSHGHILVNDKKLTIPSYSARISDKISLDQKSADKMGADLRISSKDFKSPAWLKPDKKKFSSQVDSLPQPDDFNQDIDINLIIEYYSR